MKTPGVIAAKHVGIGLLAMIAGGSIWGLLQESWPNFFGLGAVGVVLGLSVTWAAKEAYEAGCQAAKSEQASDQKANAEPDPAPNHSGM